MFAPKLLNLFMADFRWGAGMLDVFFNQKFTRNEANARYCGICSEEGRRVTESSLQMPLRLSHSSHKEKIRKTIASAIRDCQ